MSGWRKGRKASEIPKKELAVIQRKERDYRRRTKAQDAVGNAERVKKRLATDLDRPITSQEMLAIDSEERRRAFLSFFNQYGGNIAAACIAVGIQRATFVNWLNKFPEFKEYMSDVNEAMLDYAEQHLLKNIEAGKEQSLFFYLCNKGKHRGWQDVRKLAAPKLHGINININYVDNKSEIISSRSIDSVVVEDADGSGSTDAGEPGCKGEQEAIRLPEADSKA